MVCLKNIPPSNPQWSLFFPSEKGFLHEFFALIKILIDKPLDDRYLSSPRKGYHGMIKKNNSGSLESKTQINRIGCNEEMANDCLNQLERFLPSRDKFLSVLT